MLNALAADVRAWYKLHSKLSADDQAREACKLQTVLRTTSVTDSCLPGLIAISSSAQTGTYPDMCVAHGKVTNVTMLPFAVSSTKHRLWALEAHHIYLSCLVDMSSVQNHFTHDRTLPTHAKSVFCYQLPSCHHWHVDRV